MRGDQHTIGGFLSGVESTLGLIGELRHLSEHVTLGDATRVAELAAELPIRCMEADKTLAVQFAFPENTCIPLAWRSLSDVPLPICGRFTDDNVVQEVVRTQCPRFVEDARSLGGALRDLCAAEGAESILCVSAAVPGGTPVLLVCMFSERRSLTVWEIEALSIVANHLAVAFRKSPHPNHERKEKETAQSAYFGNLYRIARSITSTLDLRAILGVIRRHLATLVPADICAMILVDPGSDRPRMVHGWGIPGGDDETYVNLVLTTMQASRAANRRVHVADLSSHPAVAHCEEICELGPCSTVVVPLVIKHKVVGYIGAYRYGKQPFAKLTAQLMTSFAQLAAVAIDNARMYERQADIAAIARRDLRPRHLSRIPGYEIRDKYEPAYQVGGDYYDVIKIDKRRYAIVVADVAGRDVSAAAHISMCKHSLRALAPHIASPALLLREMNRLIYAGTDPASFISMFYAVLDTECGTLTYASAGHEPGLILRSESGLVEQLYTRGILLGVIESATFEEAHTSIEVGDVLLLYTDGLVDALDTESELGTAALERALSTVMLKPAGDIADNIHRQAMSHRAQRAPDDMALLVIKRQ